MKTFLNYITEAAEKSKSAMHITHLAGEEHFNSKEASDDDVKHLEDLHKWLKGEKSGTKSVEVKADGSPSFEMGYLKNPATGENEFGVAYKGAARGYAFTQKEVNEKFGHSEGLKSKMSQLLEHGPKIISPIHGVYQGDFMGSKKDGTIKQEDGEITHKENLIKYHYPADSDEGKQLKKAKISVHLHTRIDTPEPQFDINKNKFYKSDDVHVFNNKLNRDKLAYDPEEAEDFEKHLAKAKKHLSNIPDHNSLVQGHSAHLHTYINKTVREGTTPSTAGYNKHLGDRLQKEVDKVKTPQAKLRKSIDRQNMMKHVEQNKLEFDNLFHAHKALDKAKGVLLTTLQNSGYNQRHTINGKETHAEGFVVANKDGSINKVVDRSKEGFAGQNLNK